MELEYRKAIVHQNVDGVGEDTEVRLPVDTAEGAVEPVGAWGRRHLAFLKQNRPNTYQTMLVNGILNTYLAGVDRSARTMMDTLMEQTKQRESVTEEMKEKNQLEWIRAMESIRNRAEEIVNNELIYR